MKVHYKKWTIIFYRIKSLIIKLGWLKIISPLIIFLLIYLIFFYKFNKSFYLKLNNWNAISFYFTNKNRKNIIDGSQQLSIPFTSNWVCTKTEDNILNFELKSNIKKELDNQKRETYLLIGQPLEMDFEKMNKMIKDKEIKQVTNWLNILNRKSIPEGNIKIKGHDLFIYLNTIRTTDYNLELIFPLNKRIIINRDAKSYPVDWKGSLLQQKVAESDPILVLMQDSELRINFKNWELLGISAFKFFSNSNDNISKGIKILLPNTDGEVEFFPNNKYMNFITMFMLDEKGERLVKFNTKWIFIGIDRLNFVSSFRDKKYIADFIAINPEGKISVAGKDYNLSSNDIIGILGDDIDISHGLKGELTLIGKSNNISLNTNELIKPIIFSLPIEIQAAILASLLAFIIYIVRRYIPDIVKRG